MKLRCGVAGLGRGRMFVQLLREIEDCDVVAVCDPDPAALQDYGGLATCSDYDQFLDQGLDVVAVVSPGPAHAAQSVAALERGAHVLCETPCVYSVEEAREVVAAVEKTGLKYMLAENYIWQGWCVSLKAMADEGRFGEIVYAEGDYTHDCRDLMLRDDKGFVPYAERDGRPGAQKTWRATDLPPIQYCSHTLGPLLHLMGGRATSAFGVSICGRTPELAPTDLESALLQTETGAAIRLTNGFTVAHPYSLFYKLVGTRGSAIVMSAGQMTVRWWSEVGEPVAGWQEAPPEFCRRPDGRGDAEVMVEEFIASVRNDTAPPIDVYESMDMTVPGILAHQSGLAGGLKLDVPDLRTEER